MVDSQGPFLPACAPHGWPDARSSGSASATSTSLPYLIFNVFLTLVRVVRANRVRDRSSRFRVRAGCGAAPMVAPALQDHPAPRRTAMPANTTASSGHEARQEEGATRPPDRDRPGAGARRGRRIRRVLVRQHRPRLVPADHRLDQAQGPVRRRSTSSATATASRRSTPTPTTTSSAPRATSRRRTASTRWTYAGT